MSHWRASELQILSRLRDGFLSGTAGESDYWRSREELELYERTFAQRIGWKWDAVLGELSLRRWQPRGRRLVDWGCGSGIASRRVLAHWPGAFESLALVDRSAQALTFAAEQARAAAPQLALQSAGPDGVDCAGATVLLSHLLSELDEAALQRVLKRVSLADAILWVESGTHENARRLVRTVREELLGRGWRVVAPCTHGAGCPMLTEGQERHWCHHFARVPSEAHRDGGMRELSQRLGVDLRTLPYSFLVLENGTVTEGRPTAHTEELGAARVIGEPREFKGFLKVLSCESDALRERVLQKRDAPALFKEMCKGDRLPLYRWQLEGERIVGERDGGI